MKRATIAALFVATACDGPTRREPGRETSEPSRQGPAPVPSPTDAAGADALVAAVEVTAQDLFAAYDANEVSADERYRGKPLLVTGIVKRIAKSLRDDVYLELATKNAWHAVYATLADRTYAAKLRKGERVRVRCTGSGKTVEPTLADCSIEQVWEWIPK